MRDKKRDGMEMEMRLERGWEGPGKKDGIEVLMDDV